MTGTPRVFRPATSQEACEILGDSSAPIILSGGTEIARLIASGRLSGDRIVDVKRIDDLKAISTDETHLIVGATVKHWDIGGSAAVRKLAPSLAAACGALGNLRVRAQGSIGGNLAYGHPQTDPGTALLALGGEVRLQSATGHRWIPLTEFWAGSYSTVIEPGELVTHVRVPRLEEGWASGYRRVEILHRPPSVNVAVTYRLQDRIVESCRIAVGAVGATARRIFSLELALRSIPMDSLDSALRAAFDQYVEELSPRSDAVYEAGDKAAVAWQLIQELLTESTGFTR